MSAVVLDDVSVVYRPRRRHRKPRQGLRGVTLRVEPGESVGIVGANGAGKTTLLQTIAGVVRADAGTVTVDGRVASLIDTATGVGRDLTAEETMRLTGVLLGLPRREIARRFDEIRAASGLGDEELGLPLSTFSAGMILRTTFAVLSIADPSVLLLDEILAVADESYLIRCMEHVAAIRARGAAVLLASHDLDLLRENVERVVWLEAGAIRADGDAAAVLDAYHDASLQRAR